MIGNRMRRGLSRARIERAFLGACRAELAALKPGNVHVFADGHRMAVRDFEMSAEAAAPHIANPRLKVGARIRKAIDATLDAVGCNTNLGIVLLCTPLAAAAAIPGKPIDEAVEGILAGLDTTDAAQAFAAIARANPAGLGKVEEADVSSPATVTLREAMALAARRDRIARAYANGYREILRLALPRLKAARRRGGPPADAVTALHMALLAASPDSHIARKHGVQAARQVRDQAKALLAAARPPIAAKARAELVKFDRDLKSKGLNPGTTADIVVATLFSEAIISGPTAP
jgi:triphosphoribosyl-dephospho-CoA synthase